MSDSRPPGISRGDHDMPTPPGTPAGDAPTTLMDGRYRIERVIGAGAFGRVYLAFDTRLRRNIAIKELLARRSSTADDAYARYLERFEREARAAGVVQHPSIVAVLELAIDSDENYYLVMEYIDGTNLRDLLSQVRTLPKERAIRITIEIAQALEAVHERDIVHRDLKPANIMLTRRGAAKLADFGVAQVGHESLRTQVSSTHPGTPLYMSPEQRSSHGYIDGRSDLYSLGLILYEMLAGEPYARRRRPLEDLRPDLSPELVSVFKRLTHEDMKERYTDAGEVVVALNSVSRGPITDPPTDIAPPPIATSAAPQGIAGPYATMPPVTPSGASASGAAASQSSRSSASASSGSAVRWSHPPADIAPEADVPALPASAGRRGKRGLFFGIAAATAIGLIVAVILIGMRGTSAGVPPTTTGGPTATSVARPIQITPVAVALQPTVTPSPPPTPSPVPTPATASPSMTAPPSVAATANASDFSQWVTTEVAGLYRRNFDAVTGEYHVTFLRENTIQPILSPDTQRLGDLMIEVDVRQVAGPEQSGYGLAFRVQPLVQGSVSRAAYLFIIDGQQRYALYEQGGDNTTKSIQTLTALPPGTTNVGPNAVNHLAVTCVGDRIIVAVNGKVLNTYTATITQPGTVGIAVAATANVTGAEVAFRNLRVTPR